MSPISDPTDRLPDSVHDHEATLIDTTHGHTVLSPNAVWVRRPRKSNTPLRSPDGIVRFAGEENLRTPSNVGDQESAGDGAQTPVAKTAETAEAAEAATAATAAKGVKTATAAKGVKTSKTAKAAKSRRGALVDSSAVRAPGAEKKSGASKKKGKRSEPGQQSARRSARNSTGQVADFNVAESDAAVGPSPAGNGVAPVDATADAQAVSAVPLGGLDGPGGLDDQAPALEEGHSKRRRKKSAKLQSDEFIVDDDDASPILSREEQGSDDDEFVPGGLRVAGKASKAARGPVRGQHGACDVSTGRQRGLYGMQMANASLNQTRTPTGNVMPHQPREEVDVATHPTIRTPSMNLFRHFQETQQPSNSDLAGDIQKVLEENIQAEADLKDISDLMAEIAKVNENTLAWEEMLESKSNILDKLRMQNGTLKELFAGLGLSKSNLPDFSMKDVESDEGRKKRMLSFGRRLVSLLRHGKRSKDARAVDGLAPGGTAGAPVDTTGSVDGVGVPVAHLKEEDAKDAMDANVNEDAGLDEPDVEGRKTADHVQEGGETPSGNKGPPGTNPNELEERFHPIAAQVAGAGLQAAKGDPARAVMYLINKGFQARQADGFEGDPPPEFGVAGNKEEKGAREETQDAQAA